MFGQGTIFCKESLQTVVVFCSLQQETRGYIFVQIDDQTRPQPTALSPTEPRRNRIDEKKAADSRPRLSSHKRTRT